MLNLLVKRSNTKTDMIWPDAEIWTIIGLEAGIFNLFDPPGCEHL